MEAASLALAPAPSAAIAPALLMMLTQVAKQSASSMLKDTLLSNLRGMGCKGVALSNALAALDVRRAGAQMPGLSGMPAMPAMPAMPTMPAMSGMPGLSAMPGMPGMPGGMAGEIEAKALRLIAPDVAALPPGAGISPDMMARLQQAMSQPLSPPETLAVVDEMFELGLMPKAIQAEFNLETAVERARVGCDAVRWQGATRPRAHARNEKQRRQRAVAQLTRARSALTQKVNVVVA